jgi:hypothetical protein
MSDLGTMLLFQGRTADSCDVSIRTDKFKRRTYQHCNYVASRLSFGGPSRSSSAFLFECYSSAKCEVCR